MDGITLGLLALGLWAAALIVSRLLPRAPKGRAIPPSPESSIPPVEISPEELPVYEPVRSEPLNLPKLPDLPQSSDRELERLVRSIRRDGPAPRNRPSARRPTRKAGSNTRSLGGVSYFVVDDEGRLEQQ